MLGLYSPVTGQVGKLVGFGCVWPQDSETVALLGGHAFGKAHGACPSGPGLNPDMSPDDPWPGTCGSGPEMGKGKNTYTSGFEGAWTTTATVWSNEYYQNLLNYEFQLTKSKHGGCASATTHSGLVLLLLLMQRGGGLLLLTRRRKRPGITHMSPDMAYKPPQIW